MNDQNIPPTPEESPAERMYKTLMDEPPDSLPGPTFEALNDIALERHKQIRAYGYTHEHDDVHVGGQLAQAACYFAWPKYPCMQFWPLDSWDECFATKLKHTRREQIIIAAALLVAELERLDRADPPTRASTSTDAPPTSGPPWGVLQPLLPGGAP